MEITINYFNKLTITTNQLLLLTCGYITLILNLPFLIKLFSAVTAQTHYNVLFLLSLPVLLFSLSVILQGLVAFRWLTKPVLIVTVVCAALIFYATISYGVVFDYSMVQNIIETDMAEALSYVNASALVFFMLLALVPVWMIYSVNVSYQPIIKELSSRLKLLACSLLVVCLIGAIFYSNYASVGRNNKALISYITPYKMFDASYKFFRNKYWYPPLKFTLLDTKPEIIHENTKKHVTVLVLGETARAQNFSLNGYPRRTNLYTEQQGVVSFSHMTSCGTATAVSVPCMFSRLDHNSYDKRIATAQQNVIDLVHLAGADVLWISNNNGSCKGVCTRVTTKHISTNNANPLCDGQYCYDEALLKPLSAKLNNLTHENTLIVLHMIGSHGPTYYKRYPQNKRLFTPDCQRSDIQNCSQEQLVNSYDNTIAYTDYVLSQIIAKLDGLTGQQAIETSMLYISDHGESLGENGVYLHGLPYTFAPEQQTHVPMVFWTDLAQDDFNLNCLNAKSNMAITQDNFFDILLSVMSVRTKVYHTNNDPFIQCKSQSAIARIHNTNSDNMENIN